MFVERQEDDVDSLLAALLACIKNLHKGCKGIPLCVGVELVFSLMRCKNFMERESVEFGAAKYESCPEGAHSARNEVMKTSRTAKGP